MECCLGHKEPKTAVTGHLCLGHFRRLRGDLEDIDRVWWLLPELSTSSGGKRGKGARGKRMPAPLRLEVLDLADDARECVGGWLEVLVEQSGRVSSRPTTVPAAVRLLYVHADWIAGHEAAKDAATELHDLARRMRALVGENPPPPLGLCPECGGNLYATAGGFPVVCHGCGGRWVDGDAAHMAETVTLAWSVADAADYAGVTPRSIRLWVSAGHVRRLGRGLVHAGDTLAHAVRLQRRG